MTTHLDAYPRRQRKLAATLTVLSLLVVATIIVAVILFAPPEPAAPSAAAPPASLARLPLMDGPLPLVLQFVSPPADPSSLENIRDCFQGAAARGIGHFERELAGGALPAKEYVVRLALVATLHLYQGQSGRAAEVLAQARSIAEQAPEQCRRELPTIVFLQGVAAMRQAEDENCVTCACESSCIFPLRPQAVHRNPQGARKAVKFFTDYLEGQPDDLGVRWLLNLAYMTLGEYPERVPPAHLIPLSHFQSEFDIGRFTDIAPQLGLNRPNCAGGAIMDDFDNDGLLDIVVTSWDPAAAMAFYRNKGDGTFEDRTKAAGLEGQLGGLYCVQTDYNNDGWLDLYICRGGWTGIPQRHSLLRNNKDGTFTDVTAAAGLASPEVGQVAAWADYDNDGWLDLFVGSERGTNRLYHNRGDGTFEEVSRKAGVNDEGGLCKGAAWGDFDGDGFPDLYVANLNGPPHLFHNNRDGAFTDVAAALGITRPQCGFSCWFWDYDNDGRLDIFATSYEYTLSDIIRSQLGGPARRETCCLYRNRGTQGFEDVTRQAGLEQVMAPMGSNFMDVDNDGYLDFYLGTGDPNFSVLTPNRLFKNVDGQRFADITTSSGTGHLQKGHAVAAGDWDRDGNVDIFEQLGGAAPGDAFRNVLFQNPGHPHPWLTVKLIGTKTNRPAIGARIKVNLPGDPPRSIYRHVTSGSSFGANPFQQTIGLGKANRIASVEVHWPASGTTQVFRDVAVDQAIEITESQPAFRPLKWGRLPVPK